MSMIHYWNYPTEIFCGVDALSVLAERCALAGMRRPLLVTDPGMLELPPLRAVREHLQAAGVDYALFHGLSGNPSLEQVRAGAEVFAAGKHDSLIALGGGSALDAAKGIDLLSRDPQGLERFEWAQMLEHYPTLADYPALDLPPLIAIPTTAGTGSELGREAVLTDTAQGVKKVIGHRELLARSVILDPRLTAGLPAKLTAATGMDALTHHLEALFSPLCHPMSAGIAVEGVRLVRLHLENAVRDGNDLVAREGMLIASASAAVAFQKGLGGVHALAHPLGARHHLHHGLLNAVLLPYVLVANRSAIEADAARLARYLELEDSSFDGLLAWVLELRARVGIPATLAELGLSGEDAALIGELAVADISSSETNALALGASDYARIYRNAVGGFLK
ncbi:iron-containing alcohol dehydrogenase [Pseudomonas putida]|nr:iron-containing alcohol dehydrogenase [Pseudomonas putida]